MHVSCTCHGKHAHRSGRKIGITCEGYFIKEFKHSRIHTESALLSPEEGDDDIELEQGNDSCLTLPNNLDSKPANDIKIKTVPDEIPKDILFHVFLFRTSSKLSLLNGPGENPFRSLFVDLAESSPSLSEAIQCITCLSSNCESRLYVQGLEHKTRSLQYLRNDLFNPKNDKSVLATSLLLLFSEVCCCHVFVFTDDMSHSIQVQNSIRPTSLWSRILLRNLANPKDRYLGTHASYTLSMFTLQL